jgi:REP element-mobilizing transposase RayT
LNVQHLARQKQAPSSPVLVTLRAGPEVGNLRAPSRFREIKRALSVAKERLGLRIAQFSVMSTHLHLIVECEDKVALGRAMKGLQVRIAKALNTLVGRSGCVFTDRYHARRLRGPKEVRRALAYVLLNQRKHSAKNVRRIQPGRIDSCSSGHYFDGWRDAKPQPTEPSPVAKAKSFLLATLWKRYESLISVHEIPGSRKKART